MLRCRIMFLVTLAVALVSVACGELPSAASPTSTLNVTPSPLPTSERLIGHWENSENGYIMSFYREGTITYTSHCGLSIGDYRFLEENLIRIDMQAQRDRDAYSNILEVELAGDTLSLSSYPRTTTLKLTRVPTRRPQMASTPCPKQRT